MVNGMIYVEVLTYPQQEKLEKLLSLQKFQEHIGEEIQKMKCYKEYMALVGAIKKNWMSYLLRLEEAEKRDHRKLGKEMDLFHFREESPGAVFWHHKGWTLFQTLIDYMRLKQKRQVIKRLILQNY